MASFSNAAFAQDTAFASTAWDFGGGPPPPPPAPTTGGTVGSGGRTRRDDETPFADVPLIVGLDRPSPALPSELPAHGATQPAQLSAVPLVALRDEADELSLLRMQAGVALTELQIAAWRESRRMAMEEEEAVAMMLIAMLSSDR